MSPRARRIAAAAVQILGTQGAAALTHRAADEQAGLPSGSTSNLFRTRAALLGAACRLLTERDLDQLRRAADSLSKASDPTIEVAASRLASVIRRWASTDAVHTCARIELFLEARRSPELARALARVRTEFRSLAREWLRRFSERAPVHASTLMALIEGLTMLQLMHPATRISRSELPNEVALVLRAIVDRPEPRRRRAAR